MTKPGTKLPYEDTRIAKMIRDRIDRMAATKSQREIAADIGYDKPNVLSMYKRGEAKVPLDRLPDFARALGIDLALMFRAGLEQWWPNANKALSQMFYERIVSENERQILAYIKEVALDEDPELDDGLRRSIREAFLSKKARQATPDRFSPAHIGVNAARSSTSTDNSNLDKSKLRSHNKIEA